MEKHYHYLAGYCSRNKQTGMGFGQSTFHTDKKISHRDLENIRNFIINESSEKGEILEELAIISISNLECGCEEEEN